MRSIAYTASTLVIASVIEGEREGADSIFVTDFKPSLSDARADLLSDSSDKKSSDRDNRVTCVDVCFIGHTDAA